MDKKVEVTVSPWTIIKILFCIVLFWFVFYIKDIVLIFLAAVVIASAVESVALWFVGKHIPRILAVVFVYLVAVGLLAMFFYFILPPLVSDTIDLLNTLPRYVDLQSLGGEAGLVGFKSTVVNILNGMSLQELTTTLSRSFSAGSSFFQTATTIFGGVSSLVLIVVLSFYLSAQKDGVEKFLRLVTPIEQEVYVVRLWKRSQQMIGRWLQGQMFLGLLVGLFVYVGLLIFGVRHALLLAFVSALFELIPVFGPIFGAIPGIAIGLLDGGLGKGLIVAALYTVIQQVESNVVYPLVLKKVIGVPPLIIILALLVGFKLGGVLGMILSVPIAAILLEAVYDYQKKSITAERVELIS